eukprot:g3937.t1
MMPSLLLILLIIAALFLPPASSSSPSPTDPKPQPQHTLRDERLSASFDTDPSSSAFGRITLLARSSPSGRNVLAAQPHLNPWDASAVWEAEFVVAGSSTGSITVTSTTAAASAAVTKEVPPDSSNATRLVLKWSGIALPRDGAATIATVDVTLTIALLTLAEDSLLDHRLAFTASDASVGLWQWSLRPVVSVAAPAGASTLESKGFGLLHDPPVACGGDYPSKDATMALMAALGPGPGPALQQRKEPDAATQTRQSVYFAVHDPAGSFKHVQSTLLGGYTPETRLTSFAVTASPPDTGRPLVKTAATKDGKPAYVYQYRVPYGTMLSVFDGGWWEAASMYRRWAIPNAVWTSQGPLAARPPPAWALNLTTWINTHWQGNDIFSTTGGSPPVVEDRVSSVERRFGLGAGALALHWYEWDTLGYALGSNYTNCTNANGHCGFDTSYPEYFPPRNGFDGAVRRIQQGQPQQRQHGRKGNTDKDTQKGVRRITSWSKSC